MLQKEAKITLARRHRHQVTNARVGSLDIAVFSTASRALRLSNSSDFRGSLRGNARTECFREFQLNRTNQKERTNQIASMRATHALKGGQESQEGPGLIYRAPLVSCRAGHPLADH